MKITKELLEKHEACQSGIDWWVRNGLERLDISKIKDIKGDYKQYISWIRSKFVNVEYTYDKVGNVLTHKDSDGYSWEKTYDTAGNVLTFKDSKDFSWEKTYDKAGNVLTHKDSDDYSWGKDI